MAFLLNRSIAAGSLALMAAVTLTMTGCGDGEQKPSSDTPVIVGSDTAGLAASKAQQATAPGLDTTDGVLMVTGVAPVKGAWQLKDVTAFLDEHARAGTTLYELSLEGHDANANNHFRIRLYREGTPIETGTYDLNGTDRKLEARWEHGGIMYSSRAKGTGTVSLKTIDANHVEGSFSLTLAAVERNAEDQQITGTFNQKLNK